MNILTNPKQYAAKLKALGYTIQDAQEVHEAMTDFRCGPQFMLDVLIELAGE